MTHASRSLIVALLLGLVAAAGAASADSGLLTATTLQYGSAASHEGHLSLLFIADNPSSGNTWPMLELAAAGAEGVLYTSTAPQVSIPGTPFSQVLGSQDPQARRVPLDGPVLGILAEAQDTYQIHLYSEDAPIPYSGKSARGTVQAEEGVRMGPGAFGDEANGDDAPDASSFRLVERPGTWLVHDRVDSSFDLLVQGDMVLEVFGFTLDLQDNSGPQKVETGFWEEPTVPGQPLLQERTTAFLRLQLTDAVVRISASSGNPVVSWAAADLTLQPSGPVDLTGATGQLTRGGRTVSLDDAEATLDAGNTFTLAPSGERLDIKVRPAPVQTRGFLAEVPAPASAALVGAGAAAALLAAVAIGLLRNVLRRPELADVERAIEEGSFRKAAYLAARILARRPGDESVLLGRAIALTKSGRPEQAVREVDAHLRGAPASDGSLHYVLGLAQLDLGRDAEGRAALREAVRLTPCLHTDVAPRLGSVASKETHGYA
jgi:hypothetical protein